MKILHAADLHLDSPMRGLVEYEGAPLHEVRRASRRAFTRLIDVALAERVTLVLLAGDLYDGDFRDFSTALFLAEQVARLQEIGAQVVWLRGNHDAENRFTRHLRLPDYVHELPTSAPGSVVFEDSGLVVHGQGYATRDTTQNLALHFPARLDGFANFGLLHTALEGREGHMPYAPCTVSELSALGYDYWALGHVHQREMVSDAPYIVFPGNLQGRGIRETGPKGAMLVEVADSRVLRVEPLIVDQVRWALVEVGLEWVEHLEEALERCAHVLRREVQAAEGRPLACRVRVVGRTAAHGELLDSERFLNEVRALGLEMGQVYVESVEVRTEGELSFARLVGRGDPFAEAVAHLLSDLGSGERKDELRALLTRDLSGLPQEIVREELEDLDQLLGDVRGLLEARLLEAPTAEED
jgi:DNA repair protein SbcD/Mre11